ncbi:MAG: autotransporter-associated beta strand repeat-containing protein [Opitutaceae bacterium]|jgi:autotransporter-associated beta strand protein
MKSKTTLLKPSLRFASVALLAALSQSLPLAQATPLYWDSNSTAAGAGTTPTGTWGTSNFWNTDSAGGSGTFSAATTSADDVFFSAGADATGSPTITVNGTQSVNKITFQSGDAIVLQGGGLQIGAGGITWSSTTGTGNPNIKSAITLMESQTWTNTSAKAVIVGTTAGVANTSATASVVLTVSATGSGSVNVQNVDIIKDNNGHATSVVVDSSGSGSFSINGAQSYSGGTTVKQGTFRVDIAGGAGTGTILMGDTTGNKTTTLQNNNSNLANDITVQAGTTGLVSITALNTSSATFSGTITLNNVNLVRFNATGAATTTVSGLVTGVGGLYKSTVGSTLILTHANDYSGGTRLDQGILQIGNDSALGTGAIQFNSASTTVAPVFQSADTNARSISNIISTFGGTTAGTLYAFGAAGTGALSFTNTTSASLAGVNRIFQVDSNTSFANGFTSTGGAITKTGSATLTLGGTNTYTGATTVSAGTLLVNGSLASASAVSVANAATLGGTGTISGATTLASGSFLTPGASSTAAGKLTFGSTLNMSGATLNVFIKQAGTAGVDYSQVAATGATTITGGSLALILDDSFGSTASIGQQFTVLTSSNLIGTFTQGSSIVATLGSDTYTFGIDYGTITANALTLTLTATSAVPEPASYAALMGGLVLAGLVMRRKSRKV